MPLSFCISPKTCCRDAHGTEVDALRARPRFVLVGIQGTYNYGCEAIIRGTETILRNEWPQCSISYASLRPDDDHRRLVDTSIKVIPRTVARRPSIRWFINGLLRRISRGYLCPFERVDWANGADVVLLIGGDLYTLPPADLITPQQPFRYTHTLDLVESLMRRGKPVVVWGASVGPFEEWPSAKVRYTRHLSSVDLITAREPTTVEYLASLGITANVRSAADPAFLSPTVKHSIARRNPSRLLIGINLSPWSTRFMYPGPSADSIALQQAAAVVKLATHFNADILLIPHVVAPKAEDDDLSYLKRIHEIASAQIPDRIGLISDDLGARKTKCVLAQCDVVVASRMHCAIQAVSVATPTAFLSYSRKALGMARYVYSDDRFCLPLSSLTEDHFLDKVDDLIRNQTAIRSYLRSQESKFAQQAQQASCCLRPLILDKRVAATASVAHRHTRNSQED